MPVQEIIEQLQQILDCDGIGLILGDGIGELPPSMFATQATLYASGHLTASALAELSRNERLLALCDLAMQSERLQNLAQDASVCAGWQSIAAMPVVHTSGPLGTLLLVDRRAVRFSAGEERLLQAALAIYTHRLYHELQRVERTDAQEASIANRGVASEQLIKSEFVSMVGHELRAPLSIIKGYTGLLQIYGQAAPAEAQELSLDRQRYYLDTIMEQTNLLELLINDLLDISRLQQGNLRLQPGCVDVAALCQQIAEIGQLRANQLAPGRHSFRCTLDEQLPPVRADKDRLRQVLLNVVENAIKYSPQGGTIEITAQGVSAAGAASSIPPQWVRLVVRDEGLGIPPGASERLFRPFERLARPDTAQISGSGLGLYIAHKLIAAMDGEIAIQGQTAQGTSVTITLNAALTTEKEDVLPLCEQQDSPDLGKLHQSTCTK